MAAQSGRRGMKMKLIRVMLAGCASGLLLLAGCGTESGTSSRVEDTGAGDSTETDAGSGDTVEADAGLGSGDTVETDAFSGDTADADADAGDTATSDGSGDGSGDTTGVEPPHPIGISDFTVFFGRDRTVRLYVPASAPRSPRALVVVLHGGGGEGLGVSELGGHPLAEFRTVADREGIVIAYPEGSTARDGRLGWTDCRSDNLQASTDDDAGFLQTVVETLAVDYDLPAERRFMAGGSNGGQMTLAYAAVAAETLGGIATSNANLPEAPRPGRCTDGPVRPIAALLVHGGADTVMPFGGGCVANFGGGCARGSVIGAEATRDAFLLLNGLPNTPTTSLTVEVDPDDAGTAERFVYAGPTPVAWWRMNGAGHPIASRAIQTATTAAAGAQNRDIEFAEIAWSFFAAQLPTP